MDEQKKLAVIERKQEFPRKLRSTIEEAIEKKLAPAGFLFRIEKKLLDLLWENSSDDRIDETKGFNSDRDTEAEVEVAIRFFPDVLTTIRYNRYPIRAQLGSYRLNPNLKSVSFVPLLAKLAIEFDLFTEEERGGLAVACYKGSNVFNVFFWLAIARDHDEDKVNDEKHVQLVDESFLAAMKQLRENGLFKKEDIQKFDLV